MNQEKQTLSESPIQGDAAEIARAGHAAALFLAPVVDGAAHATRDRAGVIVISDGAADSRLLEPVVKATVVADAASSGHWIAHAAQAAMADPRGAVHVAITDPEAPALPLAWYGALVTTVITIVTVISHYKELIVRDMKRRPARRTPFDSSPQFRIGFL